MPAVILIALMIFLPAFAYSEISEYEHFTREALTDDMRIFEAELKRNPDNTAAVKALMRLRFTIEDFEGALRLADGFLKKHDDREVAYTRITALTALSRYKEAAASIDGFIAKYAPPEEEKKYLLIHRELLLKFFKTKPYPLKFAKIENSEGLHIIAILHEQGEIFGRSEKTGKFFYIKISDKTVRYDDITPAWLSDIEASRVKYLCLSHNSDELLASVEERDGSSSILYRQLGRDGWSDPERLPGLNPGRMNSYANFSSDARTALFVSDADKSGGLDIYCSTKSADGNWEAPVKAEGINTLMDEISLFVHPDGETAIFSTNGLPGHGGFDLFAGKIEKTGKTFRLVSAENIHHLNTFRNETCPLLIDPVYTRGFFNFERGGVKTIYCGEDVGVKPNPVALLQGSVRELLSRQLITDADVRITMTNKKELRGASISTSGVNGSFSMPLEWESKYIMSINIPGYIYYRDYIEVPKNKKVIKKDFYVEKGIIVKGFIFEAAEILFDTGSAVLKAKSYGELDELKNFLDRNPWVEIEVAGYTDNQGSFDYNLDLSKRRADSIAQYLIKLGVSGNRLKVKGLGFSKSVATNETHEGRRRNRRVEITVINEQPGKEKK